MKVLLLQEMSGVHTELKNGLIKLGIDAQIATLGDGLKGYSTDLFLGSNKNGIIPSINRATTQLMKIKTFNEFDVIQTISPNPFHKFISPIMEKFIFSGSKKLIYIAAGSDAIYRKHVRDLEYYPPHDWYDNEREYNRLSKMLKEFSTIVPVCWEYKYAMSKAGYSTEPIMPFPINLEKHSFKEFKPTKRINIFHPINRPNTLSFDFKGTKLIQEVFDELSKKYTNVNFISKGGLNHKEYNLLVDKMDIIVDQTYSYSYGMSAAYGLAKGQVVLSGLEEQAKDNEYYKNCPIINIKPNKDDIKNKIEYLINNQEVVVDLSLKSRLFAEKYHDNIAVAQRFIELYNQ